MATKTHLEHKIFPAPKNCTAFEAIVVRRVDAEDQLAAGRLARERQSLDEDEADQNTMHELVRISIVALKKRGASKPARVRQPFTEFDRWDTVAHRVAREAFLDLNSVGEDAVKKMLASAEQWNPAALAEEEGGEVLQEEDATE